MSYTKGPWRTGNVPTAIVSDSRVEGAPKNGGWNDFSDGVDHFYGGNVIAESIYRVEDRNLIAAAPDMYESGKEMAEAVALLSADDGRIIGLLPILCRLRQALAKAEGRE